VLESLKFELVFAHVTVDAELRLLQIHCSLSPFMLTRYTLFCNSSFTPRDLSSAAVSLSRTTPPFVRLYPRINSVSSSSRSRQPPMIDTKTDIGCPSKPSLFAHLQVYTHHHRWLAIRTAARTMSFHLSAPTQSPLSGSAGMARTIPPELDDSFQIEHLRHAVPGSLRCR
jgi:hypothetical protein